LSKFEDRICAGQKLSKAIAPYAGERPLVLAIPRGGVRVGFEVAKSLCCDFSIVVVRKLPLPDSPEAGFGAVAEDGSTYFVEHVVADLPPGTVDRIVEEQKQEAARRVRVLREGKPLPAMQDRNIILVDDGIAMGSTMRAAIMLCRKKTAKEVEVIVAAPVAGPSVVAELSGLADKVIVLEKPVLFRAVAQAYANWYDVSDAEVLDIMKTWEQQAAAGVGSLQR
jgi:putative phosphoribosyl transferase